MENRYRVYTGPTQVDATADRLDAAGYNVYLRGTEAVYVVTERSEEAVLQALGPTWKSRDVLLLGRS